MTKRIKKIIDTKPQFSPPQFTFEPCTFVKNWTIKEMGNGYPVEYPKKGILRIAVKFLVQGTATHVT